MLVHATSGLVPPRHTSSVKDVQIPDGVASGPHLHVPVAILVLAEISAGANTWIAATVHHAGWHPPAPSSQPAAKRDIRERNEGCGWPDWLTAW